MIVTLCGSARFERLFHILNEALTVNGGRTVFSLTTFPSVKGAREWYTDVEKIALDNAHKRKISASSAVLVINRHGYIGESTLSEIEHARGEEKRIYYLESWGKGCGVGPMHTDAIRADKRAWGIPDDYVSPIDTSNDRSVWDLLGEAGEQRSRYVELIQQAATFPEIR